MSAFRHPRPMRMKGSRHTGSGPLVPQLASVSQQATVPQVIVFVKSLQPFGQELSSHESAGVQMSMGLTHGESHWFAAHAIVSTAFAGTSAAYRGSTMKAGPLPAMGPLYVHVVSVHTSREGGWHTQSSQWSNWHGSGGASHTAPRVSAKVLRL